MAIISKTEFDRLVEVSQLQNLADNSYLKDVNNENFKWICQQFFYGNKKDTELFNVGSGLFSTMQTVFTNFVGNPKIGKEFDLSERVNDYIATGYCAFVLYREDGVLGIRREAPESVSYENGVYRVIKIYVKDVGSTSGKLVSISTVKKTYVLVQTYGDGLIENKLYEVKGLYQLTAGTDVTEVPLNTIFETEGLNPVEKTGFETPTIYLIKNREDELLTKIKSIITKTKNMVYSIDRRITMFDNQFLNNVESFILLKNIVLPKKTLEKYNEGKEVNFKQLGRVLTANDDGGIEFINNKNELIDKAISYEEVQIRRISSLTTIPTDFLGLTDGNGGIGTGSREVLHGAFVKTIQNIREVFTKGLTPILEVFAKESDNPFEDEISRGDVFAKDSKALIDELKVARDAGLISKLRAIKTYFGFDEDEAMKELEQIESETEIEPVEEKAKEDQMEKDMENDMNDGKKDNNAIENGKDLPTNKKE